MAFASKRNLSRHEVKQHKLEGPYKCTLCPKTFGKKCELIEHCAKYHEGEKMPLVRSKKIPFRCAVCEVSFVSKDLLLEHKAVAHGLTQRRKRDGKLKMKTGKKPKKLENVDKKEVNENEKAENKDVDLNTVPLPISKYLLPLQGYTVS